MSASQSSQGYLLRSQTRLGQGPWLDLFIADGSRLGARIPVRFNASVWLPQPFQLLSLEWQRLPQGGIRLLQLEPERCCPAPTGKALACGFYLNELLIRLLSRGEPWPRLFLCYQQLMRQLPAVPAHGQLRCFEYELLSSIGFAIDWWHDSEGQPLQPEKLYQYFPEAGWVPRHGEPASTPLFEGDLLRRLAIQDWTTLEKSALKRLRLLLQALLNDQLGRRPLKSRELLLSLSKTPQ